MKFLIRIAIFIASYMFFFGLFITTLDTVGDIQNTNLTFIKIVSVIISIIVALMTKIELSRNNKNLKIF
jgi:type III secretory pathway component EscS